MSHATPAAIMQIGTGFMGSKTLLSAVELGVFSALANGAADLPTLQQKPQAASAFGPRLLRCVGGAQPAGANERRL